MLSDGTEAIAPSVLMMTITFPNTSPTNVSEVSFFASYTAVLPAHVVLIASIHVPLLESV